MTDGSPEISAPEAQHAAQSAAPDEARANPPVPSPPLSQRDPLEGIHDLPVKDQISRYRLIHESLTGRLAAEAE